MRRMRGREEVVGGPSGDSTGEDVGGWFTVARQPMRSDDSKSDVDSSSTKQLPGRCSSVHQRDAEG